MLCVVITLPTVALATSQFPFFKFSVRESVCYSYQLIHYRRGYRILYNI